MVLFFLALAGEPSAALLPASSPTPGRPTVSASSAGKKADAERRDPLADLRQVLKDGRYAEAEASARALLHDVETKDGPASLEAATVIDILVESLSRGGKGATAEARALAERAVEIKEALPGGSSSLDLAASLIQLAIVLRESGDFVASESSFLRAAAIQEQKLGASDLELAKTFNSLAILYLRAGTPEKARPLFERALKIREDRLGPDHPDLGPVIGNLAEVSRDLGDYAAAQPLLQRAVDLRERTLGSDHPETAKAINNLANFLADTGDYSGARSRYEQAIRLMEKSLGEEHPSFARAINNLATVYRDMGDLDNARRLFERALEIRERVLGPDHLDVARVRNRLGFVLVAQERPAEAETHFERALQIATRQVGPTSAPAAEALAGMANVALANGDLGTTRALYARALGAMRESLGENHPDLAQALLDFGRMLFSRGYPSEARAPLEEARRIWEKEAGPTHIGLSEVLATLAGIDATEGAYDAAMDNALRAERTASDRFRVAARGLTGAEALRFERIRASGLDTAFTVLLARPKERAGVRSIDAVWDQVIRSRAMVLDELIARHRSVLERRSPETKTLEDAFERATASLARLTVQGAADVSLERHLALLQRAEEERAKAERALADASESFRGSLKSRSIGLDAVRRAIPEGAALVAYVRFLRLTAVPTGSGPRRPRVWTPFYAALVARSNGDTPRLVPLGPAEKIEAQVAAWTAQASTAPQSADAVRAVRATGSSLRASVWDPLDPLLTGSNMILIVPDGALHALSFASLPSGHDGFLVETVPPIQYLSAERTLVRGAGTPPPGDGLLVLGGAVFDEAPEPHLVAAGNATRAAGSPAAAPAGDPAATAFASLVPPWTLGEGCATFTWPRFRSLPGSGAEAHDIETLWRDRAKAHPGDWGDVVTLTGIEADEAAFKRLAPGRRVIHLATHGFSLESSCARATRVRAPQGSSEVPEAAASLMEAESLRLSGLALAGANLAPGAATRQARGGGGDGGEDGVLVSEEVATLDLRGVEWVVLSACETGIGPTQSGEGVLGLRRAFETAGAGSLILTLWPVTDYDTRAWMRELYRARFDGQSTAEAVRTASLRIISERRRAKFLVHPYSWGAFVAAGDWR